MEIYNENVNDLLSYNKKGKNLTLNFDKGSKIKVENLTKIEIKSPDELIELL